MNNIGLPPIGTGRLGTTPTEQNTVHACNGTRARDNTLAVYGARHRSPAYYALRGAARTLIVAVPLIGGFIYNII